jgi:hypothetical protein
MKLKRGSTNPITIATACIYMLNNITVLSISFFLPTIIKSIYPGRTAVQQQLLTVPPYIVGGFFVLLIPTLSWRFDHRQWFLAITGPTAMAGFSILLATLDANVRYGAIFLTASTAFTLGAMCNAQVSANVLSDSARSIAIGTNGTSFTILSLVNVRPDTDSCRSHVRQHWWPHCNVDIPPLGYANVPHW